MSRTSLIFKYSGFSLLAILANLTIQRGVLIFGDGTILYGMALCLGTAVGLILKYTLDRRWIFYQAPQKTAAKGRQFALYSMTGVITTLLYAAVETVFWLTWQSHFMREVGAVAGLVAGYMVKYHLDRRIVFCRSKVTL